jgi:hypothetical protein
MATRKFSPYHKEKRRISIAKTFSRRYHGNQFLLLRKHDSITEINFLIPLELSSYQLKYSIHTCITAITKKVTRLGFHHHPCTSHSFIGVTVQDGPWPP